MTRLIDADALIEIFDKDKYERVRNEYQSGYNDGLLHAEIVAEDVADDMPTVDAVPVRHGKWIIRDNPGTGWYRITCSECGEDVTSTAPCIGFFPNAKVVWDYCPYCGTRMDEK